MAKKVALTTCINPTCHNHVSYQNDYCVECATIEIIDSEKAARALQPQRRLKLHVTEYDKFFLASVGIKWS